jgi:hypothetical protein
MISITYDAFAKRFGSHGEIFVSLWAIFGRIGARKRNRRQGARKGRLHALRFSGGYFGSVRAWMSARSRQSG